MKQSARKHLLAILLAAICLASCAVTSPSLPLTSADHTENHIRFLEERVTRDPEDFIANNKLATAYLQRLRESGDIGFLNLATRAAQNSLKTLPAEQNKGGLIALARVAFSSHDFSAALSYAQRLVILDPDKSYPYQFLGDALLELGQYAEADVAFKRMQALGGLQTITQVAIEQRLAHRAWLHGEPATAIAHYTEALNLTPNDSSQRETRAWCQWQLGETAFAMGKYAVAEKHYRDSLMTFPNYFRSIAALGRVYFARGDLRKAIEFYEQVVQILPDPSFIATLGDLYQISGRKQDAHYQYQIIEQIGRLGTVNGDLYNRQLALFRADHDLEPEAAYQSARNEYTNRRDIYGADALAWTAFKAGELPVAQSAIQEALRLGTQDAKLFYHAGMIAQASGDHAAARRHLQAALALNPAFDPLQSKYARAALHALSLSRN